MHTGARKTLNLKLEFYVNKTLCHKYWVEKTSGALTELFTSPANPTNSPVCHQKQYDGLVMHHASKEHNSSFANNTAEQCGTARQKDWYQFHVTLF